MFTHYPILTKKLMFENMDFNSFFYNKDHEELNKFKGSAFLPPFPLDRIMKKTEESESHIEPEIKRKVQQKRHCSTYQLSPLSPASKKCLTHVEVGREFYYYFMIVYVYKWHLLFGMNPYQT